MPSKAQRAAARQAQLRRRRRRGKGRTQQFDAGPSEAEAASAAPRPSVTATVEQPAAPAVVPASRRSRPARRSRQGAQAEPLQTNPYLGSEFRQIGLITTLIVSILVVLTFVLR